MCEAWTQFYHIYVLNFESLYNNSSELEFDKVIVLVFLWSSTSNLDMN